MALIMKANSFGKKFGLLLLAFWSITGTFARAETFIFIAQPDPPPNGPINYSWFSANNWFTNDPITLQLDHADTIPAPGDTAVIDSAVNAAGNTIYIATLILDANITVSGGDFIASLVQMYPGNNGGETSFSGSIIEVRSEMDVLGGSCGLTSCTLTIDSGAFCQIGVGSIGQLGIYGCTVFNVGQIIISPNSELAGGTNVINMSGATISGNSNAVVSDSEFSRGNLDNSGTVRCDGGTMQVSFSTWSSSSGIGKFKTTTTNAIIQFPSSLTVPAGVTNIFSGPGLSQFQNGAAIQGTAQIGVIDPSSGMLDAGNLEFAGQLGGTGMLHVVALPNMPSTLLVNPNLGGSGSITGLVANIDAGGQFNINYNYNSLGLTISGATINNSGTVTWTGAGGITLSQNSIFNNLLGGLFDCQVQNSGTDGTISGGPPPGGGAINNSGTFRKSAGTNGIVFLDFEYPPGPDFNNSGLLDIQSGQMQISGGTSSGTFNLAPGAELWFNGGTNFLNAGTQFTGTNFVRVNPTADLLFNTNVAIANFQLNGGAVDGPGNLIVTNIFNWTGGIMQGSGAVNIPVGASLDASSGSYSASLTQRTINNAGTTIMTNSFVGAYAGAIFNNLAGAILEIRNGGGFGFPNPLPAPVPVLNNFGTIHDISTSTAPLAFNITNKSIVQIQSSQLNCYAFQQLSGTTTVASNATLNPEGITLQGGTLNGAGTVEGNSSYGLTNSGGIVSPGNSPGILTVANSSYTQTGAGVLAIEIGGTNAGAQYDQLALNNASLNGTLNVSLINGFNPSLGDNYTIVTTPFYTGISGTFSTLNGLHATNGLVLVPVYGNYGVNLVAANDPVMSSTSHGGNQFTFHFPTTTGFTNIVEYTDSLNPPNWQPLATVIGDGTVKSATDPLATNAHRFYRVRFQ
jgi:hypothetical protein